MFEKLFSAYNSIVLFDTETTGLNAEKGDRIIELGAIKLTLGLGTPVIEKEMDDFVALPKGKTLPSEITKLTGITPKMLEEKGLSMTEVVSRFLKLTGNGEGKVEKPNVLLVAHNAQFDATFLRSAFCEYVANTGKAIEANFSFLDTLTVYKDRRNFPHRLENAIFEYGLEGQVKNSHRAVDDVKGLFAVMCAMEEECPNLHEYVNHFGYNPKYGISGKKVKGVQYHEQPLTYQRRGIEEKPFFEKRGDFQSR